MGPFSPRQSDSAAYPLQSLFAPIPLVCFTLTFGTDVIFWNSANVMWQNFSAWLLFAGLIGGGLALVAGLIDLIRPRTRPLRAGLAGFVLFLLILALGFLNSLIHAGDGWTAVVPYGLAVSLVTVVLIVVAIAAASRKYAKLAWRV